MLLTAVRLKDPLATMRAIPQRWGQFERALALIAGAALVLRALYTLVIAPNLAGPGDFYFYHWSANLIADGRGYIDPVGLAFQGVSQPTAIHPPLWSFVLSVVSFFGGSGEPVGHLSGHDFVAHRLTGGVCGTATVILLGYLGRRVGGTRVGLVAAGAAALYPVLIMTDGSLLSESLYGALITSTLLLSYRLVERPTRWRALVLGAALGFAALTREESLLLVILLFVPLAGFPARWFKRRASPRLIGIACLGTALVVLPWSIRNWVAFGQPVLVSTGAGAVVAGANCQRTYAGKFIGFWDITCIPPRGKGNEADYTGRWQDKGLRYARQHVGRLFVVGVVRVLRTWGLYQTTDDPGQPSQPLAVAFYLVLLPFAIGGAVLLKRGRDPLLMLLAPMLLVTMTSLVGYGTTRFRAAAEPSLLVLAAVAMVYVWEHRKAIASWGQRARPVLGPPQ